MQQTLSNQNICQIVDEVNDYFTRIRKADRRSCIRLRLEVEEILLRWQNAFGTDQIVECQFGGLLHRNSVELRLAGSEHNPTLEDSGDTVYNLLDLVGMEPSYQYRHKTNYVTIPCGQKKGSGMAKILLAVLLAVLCTFLSRVLPETVSKGLMEDLITPTFDCFLGFLTAVAGPLIFVSVMSGILAMNDASKFALIGKKLILFSIGSTFLSGGFALLFGLIFFRFNTLGNASSGSQLHTIYTMFLDIIPQNLLEPFLSGNSLQIIFLALLLGGILLILGKEVQIIAECVMEVEKVIQKVNELLVRLMPLLIFTGTWKLLMSKEAMDLLKALKVIGVFLAAAILWLVFSLLYVCARYGISPWKVFRKCVPAIIIATLTASSVAAFEENVTICKQKLGIDSELVDFGIPLGQIIYMPGALMLFLFTALFFAESQQVPVNVGWFLMLVIMSGLLAIAVPPTPGSTLSCIVILFTQLGISPEALALAASIALLLEYPVSGCDLGSVQLMLLLVGKKLKKVNETVLKE